jgi:hypothetical protein
MEIPSEKTVEVKANEPWQPMSVACLGDIVSLVQHGGGKLSTPTFDPGESLKKPSGHDH